MSAPIVTIHRSTSTVFAFRWLVAAWSCIVGAGLIALGT
jgi:hypothetical protein